MSEFSFGVICIFWAGLLYSFMPEIVCSLIGEKEES
jgi:hypothetical protein